MLLLSWTPSFSDLVINFSTWIILLVTFWNFICQNLKVRFNSVFYSGHTNLHFHQQCTRASFPPYPCQCLLFLIFLRMAILTVMYLLYLFFGKMSTQLLCSFLIDFFFVSLFYVCCQIV